VILVDAALLVCAHVEVPGVQANLVHDAHLAALAIERAGPLLHGRRLRTLSGLALGESDRPMKSSPHDVVVGEAEQ
jgi:hypothetical protein